MKPAGFSERERQNICWWKWGSPLSIKYMKSKHGTAGSYSRTAWMFSNVKFLFYCTCFWSVEGELNPLPKIYKYRQKVTHLLPISLIREVGDSAFVVVMGSWRLRVSLIRRVGQLPVATGTCFFITNISTKNLKPKLKFCMRDLHRTNLYKNRNI